MTTPEPRLKSTPDNMQMRYCLLLRRGGRLGCRPLFSHRSSFGLHRQNPTGSLKAKIVVGVVFRLEGSLEDVTLGKDMRSTELGPTGCETPPTIKPPALGGGILQTNLQDGTVFW